MIAGIYDCSISVHVARSSPLNQATGHITLSQVLKELSWEPVRAQKVLVRCMHRHEVCRCCLYCTVQFGTAIPHFVLLAMCAPLVHRTTWCLRGWRGWTTKTAKLNTGSQDSLGTLNDSSMPT